MWRWVWDFRELCKYRFVWSGKWKTEMDSTHPCNKQTNNSIATSKLVCPNVKGRERSIREMVPSFLVVVVCAKILPLGGIHKLRWKDFTQYWPTHPHPVDICEVIIPWLKYNIDKIRENLHTIDISSTTDLPTSSCQHSLWMPPYLYTVHAQK